jgi:hypothetical protein
MSTLAGDFWVCGECRSINNAGAKQCYNCRTPRDLAAVDPETIDPSSHGKLREIELPPFRPTRGVALLATIGIVAIAIMQAYNTFIAASVIQLQIDGAVVAPNQIDFANTVGFVTLGVAALALIGWSLWLSRVVTAMPALGLGYPAADGFMAFVENFLPGLNLYRVPAIVRDVVHRLEPGTVRGEAVIFASWLALLGGVLVPRIGAAVTGTTLQSGPDALRTTMLVAIVASLLVAIGAAGLIALIWWVEGRIARRHEAQLAEAPATGTTPTEQPAMTRNAVEPLATRSAFAAVGTGLAQPDASSPAGPAVATPPVSGFSLPQVAPVDPPDDAGDDAWAQVTARRMEAAPVPAAPAEPAPVAVPEAEPPVVEAAPEPPAAPVEMAAPVETTAPVEMAAPIETPAEAEVAVPLGTPPETELLGAQPTEPLAPVEQPEPAGTEAEAAGPPHLMIKVGAKGMITAEVDGEVEHLILDDLTAYADALAKVDGTAAIVAASDDPMAGLIARRAQRILADAGIDASIPD